MNINCSYILLDIGCMSDDSGFYLFQCVTGGQLIMPKIWINGSNTNDSASIGHNFVQGLSKTMDKLDLLGTHRHPTIGWIKNT